MDVRFTRGGGGRWSYDCELLSCDESPLGERCVLRINEWFRVVSYRGREDIQNQIIAELERRATTWMLYDNTPQNTLKGGYHDRRNNTTTRS